MTSPSDAKHGHRVIYSPYVDERGRRFHQRHEDNGGIPGAYRGFSPDGETWVCIQFAKVDAEPPVWQGGRVPTFNVVTCANGRGCYVLLPDNRSCFAVDAHAIAERHADDTVCARCGGSFAGYGWLIDARTVMETVRCSTCANLLGKELNDAMPTYREMQCRCGVLCYEQVSPATRERGDYNDVLPCPKCARLACAECLAEGAKACRGCVKTRRRKAA